MYFIICERSPRDRAFWQPRFKLYLIRLALIKIGFDSLHTLEIFLMIKNSRSLCTQDLLSDKGSKGCSRKSLLLTGGLTGGVIIIVVVLILTLGGMDDGGNSSEIKDPKPGFTLEDYLNGKFSAIRFNATWVSGTYASLYFTQWTYSNFSKYWACELFIFYF